MKFDGQLGTWLKKIQNQGLNWKSTQIEGFIWNIMCFGASFHLNKTTLFHALSLFIKNKPKRCHFERHHVASSSPASSFIAVVSLPSVAKKTRHIPYHATIKCNHVHPYLPSCKKRERRAYLVVVAVVVHTPPNITPWQDRAGWPPSPLLVNREERNRGGRGDREYRRGKVICLGDRGDKWKTIKRKEGRIENRGGFFVSKNKWTSRRRRRVFRVK